MKQKIILASASPRRRELLKMVGYDFEIIPSEAEEKTDETQPDKIVIDLSRQKAFDVLKRVPNGMIVASDTIVWVGGRILGKPKSREEASEMLHTLAGNVHTVYTGVTVLNVKNSTIIAQKSFCEHTDVFIVEMTDEEIDEYIATGAPFDKAGGYGVQGVFGKYVNRVEGDYFCVVGLPLASTCRCIEDLSKIE